MIELSAHLLTLLLSPFQSINNYKTILCYIHPFELIAGHFRVRWNYETQFQPFRINQTKTTAKWNANWNWHLRIGEIFEWHFPLHQRLRISSGGWEEKLKNMPTSSESTVEMLSYSLDSMHKARGLILVWQLLRKGWNWHSHFSCHMFFVHHKLVWNVIFCIFFCSRSHLIQFPGLIYLRMSMPNTVDLCKLKWFTCPTSSTDLAMWFAHSFRIIHNNFAVVSDTILICDDISVLELVLNCFSATGKNGHFRL